MTVSWPVKPRFSFNTMANQEHIEILERGVNIWNRWRGEHPDMMPDLSGALLQDRDFKRADFRDAEMSGVSLEGSDLSEAEFCHTKLREADFSRAKLFRTDFFKADLRGAKLIGADMRYSTLVETSLAEATITDCQIYGMSVWNLKEKPQKQSNLIITCADMPTITVNNLKLAQFVFLVLNNRNIREVIDAMSDKVVLILGRFTSERKELLELMREQLIDQRYSPLLFDFERPCSRDLTETISYLASMSRFIIADITDPRSVPHELASIVPNLRSIPIQPVIADGEVEYALFESLRAYPWVLETFHYQNADDLRRSFPERVVAPAEKWLEEKRLREKQLGEKSGR